MHEPPSIKIEKQLPASPLSEHPTETNRDKTNTRRVWTSGPAAAAAAGAGSTTIPPSSVWLETWSSPALSGAAAQVKWGTPRRRSSQPDVDPRKTLPQLGKPSPVLRRRGERGSALKPHSTDPGATCLTQDSLRPRAFSRRFHMASAQGPKRISAGGQWIGGGAEIVSDYHICASCIPKEREIRVSRMEACDFPAATAGLLVLAARAVSSLQIPHCLPCPVLSCRQPRSSSLAPHEPDLSGPPPACVPPKIPVPSSSSRASVAQIPRPDEPTHLKCRCVAGRLTKSTSVD